MNLRPNIDLEESKEGVLWCLYKSLNDPKQHYWTMAELTSELKLSLNLIALAVEGLENEQLCKSEEDENFTEHPITGNLVSYDETRIEITPLGFDEVKKWPDEKYEKIVQKFRSSIEIVALAKDFDEALKIPASDRTVNLNHNSEKYHEAVKTLEEVIQEFKKDHTLDNVLGHEKGALLKALEGGRELLDDITLNLRIGTALLIEPLKRIVEKYDQVLVGTLAATAMNLILRLFG